MDKDILITEWVENHTADLIKWALHKTSSLEIAEDLVQDTFISAWNGFSSFEHKSSAKTWLFRILNNKIIDYYRKRNPEYKEIVSFEEEAVMNYTDSLFNKSNVWNDMNQYFHWQQDDHLLDNPDFKQIMDDCIDDLPSNWKFIITSKYLQDKSTTEICQDANITASNYWQIVHRSKLLLRKCIDNLWKN